MLLTLLVVLEELELMLTIRHHTNLFNLDKILIHVNITKSKINKIPNHIDLKVLLLQEPNAE